MNNWSSVPPISPKMCTTKKIGKGKTWRMQSSGMWRCIYLVWTDILEECITSIFRVEKSEPPAHAGSLLADFSTLKMEVICSSETSVHTRSTWRHIPEDSILHSHHRENLKSYKAKHVPLWESTPWNLNFAATYEVQVIANLFPLYFLHSTTEKLETRLCRL
jgi:hypothetical protein